MQNIIALGLVGALTLVFIALTMTGHIASLWFWILSPFWLYMWLAVITTEMRRRRSME